MCDFVNYTAERMESYTNVEKYVYRGMFSAEGGFAACGRLANTAEMPRFAAKSSRATWQNKRMILSS